ncbi:MAG: class I SAM-dependent methyltransferase [Candidatus Solibacter usitatus]|nr:class I SAM-dependent methyltransferase [Candidatus Solibacter usitatus]
MDDTKPVLAREVEYHEKLYAGFAQQHFAKPAVRALRAHMVARILTLTRTAKTARVLSLGCGIGDTEVLLAPSVAELVGIDLSPSAIRQARLDAASAGASNLRFIEGSLESAAFEPESFDLVIAIFFLHHLPQALLESLPGRVYSLLRPRGRFYSLDPSSQRLSGAVGSLVVPRLMRKYQSPDERQLDREETAALFSTAGFAVRSGFYDFLSSPLAGLAPGWRFGYEMARRLDNALVRTPGLSSLGSNFEIIAHRPPRR